MMLNLTSKDKSEKVYETVADAPLAVDLSEELIEIEEGSKVQILETKT